MLDNWFTEPTTPSLEEEVPQGPYEGPDYFGFVTGKMDDPNVGAFVTAITKETHVVGKAGIPHDDREKVNRRIDAAIDRAVQACDGNLKILTCFVMGMLGQALDEEMERNGKIEMTAEILSGTLPEILERLRKKIENEEG